MKTIKDVFLSFQRGLETIYNTQETSSITLMVLEELTGMSRTKIKAFPEDDVPAGAVEKLTGILDELKTGKPVQYILGTTEFYGLNFLVNPSVLIPRPETEELVEWVLQTLKLNTGIEHPFSILDIGTGSGCIVISLKKNLPGAKATAIDISRDALQTAAQNAVINDVKVEFIELDILQTEQLRLEDGNKFDLIISNPPYVTLEDKLQMHQNVTGFEPHTALFVPVNDPLIFYRVIAGFAAEHLNDGGFLFFEANESYGKQTVELLHDKRFIDIELKQDMSGRDRMIKATWKEL